MARYTANTDHITFHENQPKFQVEIVLYDDNTCEDLSDVESIYFNNRHDAEKFADFVDYIKTDDLKLITDIIDTIQGNKRTPQKIEVGITECDVDDFVDLIADNSTIEWVYVDQFGKTIEVEIMTEDELNQRGH